MAIVVDTDVISFTFKENPRAELYQPHLVGVSKFISFMTLAELRRWALQYGWGDKKKRKLADFLDDYGIIYADEELCDLWAQAIVSGRENGKPIDVADAWVRAVALKFAVPLITHNRTHFEGVENLILISETE